MSERKEILIRIADVAHFKIQTNPDEEASWLSARDRINDLWVAWTKHYTNKSSKEILAMIALRFAQAYQLRKDDELELTSTLESFEHEIDRMILGMDSRQSTPVIPPASQGSEEE